MFPHRPPHPGRLVTASPAHFDGPSLTLPTFQGSIAPPQITPTCHALYRHVPLNTPTDPIPAQSMPHRHAKPRPRLSAPFPTDKSKPFFMSISCRRSRPSRASSCSHRTDNPTQHQPALIRPQPTSPTLIHNPVAPKSKRQSRAIHPRPPLADVPTLPSPLPKPTYLIPVCPLHSTTHAHSRRA